jgi:hypothetical protein
VAENMPKVSVVGIDVVEINIEEADERRMRSG